MATYRKKLIEVALPLKAINDESSRRKRKAPAGYPTTFHKWWAQRPLAACRAVLFASLVDDPESDYQYANLGEEITGKKRADLFNLIEELVLWDNSNNSRVINKARAEIARCVVNGKLERKEINKTDILVGDSTAWDFQQMLAGPDDVNALLLSHAPPMLDPFCGGGSIPLEAQRLGLRVYASDLNPVPVLITKALIEIPPKFAGRPPVNKDWQAKKPSEKAATTWTGAQGLAEDVRYFGEWMRDEAAKRIGNLYPKIAVSKEMARFRPDLIDYVGQELNVIAWLWARTVPSPNPVCAGAHVPLTRSFWLSTKNGKQAWAEPIIDKATNTYRFEVRTALSHPGESPPKGIMSRKGGRCLLTNVPMLYPHVRSEATAGRMDVRLMAIVAEGSSGRIYLSPDDRHVRLAKEATPKWRPDLEMPKKHRNFQPPVYGMNNLGDLFTARQLQMLSTFSDLISEVREYALITAQKSNPSDDNRPLSEGGRGAKAYADSIALYLAAAMSRMVDYNSSLASWRPKDNAMRSTLAKQALPMVWDFAEANPFEKSSAGFVDCVRVVAKCLEILPASADATVEQVDAMAGLKTNERMLVSTDPPYYSNISYAELSDFLYVWLRRSMSPLFPSLFATVVSPKTQELIAAPARHGNDAQAAKVFFEQGLRKAFGAIRGLASCEYPVTVYYAFKQTETDDEEDDDEEEGIDAGISVASTGWETMLEGLIGAGLTITGTWPMRTEGDNRQVGIGQNALASSIVLVCRERPQNAPLATRKEFIGTLRGELPDALRNLQLGNIAPVDLAQAAIGPGMAVFTRYAKVMESDGSPMAVRTALGIINQVLDEVLAEQEGEFDAETRWALAWFEQSGMGEGQFGIAETLSKAKNTAVNGLVEAGIVNARAGKVKLVGRDDLPDNWDPTTDNRLTAWETTQHLIRALETSGESGAAALVGKLGGVAENARDLAYRLYSICERKKWAEEALAYNGLVIAWPELTKLAIAERNQKPDTQQEMF